MQLGSAAARGEINVLINSGELLRAMGWSPGLEHWTPLLLRSDGRRASRRRYLASGKSSRSGNDNPLSPAEDNHLTCDRTRHLRSHLLELATMTGDQSRGLSGARVCWGDDKNDRGTITERNWSGVTLRWDNRDNQSVSHNDMKMVFLIAGNKFNDERHPKKWQHNSIGPHAMR